MVSGRSGSYQAVSCHPDYFKAERQLSLLPAGRFRPEAVFGDLRKQTFDVEVRGRRNMKRGGNHKHSLWRSTSLLLEVNHKYGKPWHKTVRGIIEDGRDLKLSGSSSINSRNLIASATFLTSTDRGLLGS
jgi:hypothetical protein